LIIRTPIIRTPKVTVLLEYLALVCVLLEYLNKVLYINQWALVIQTNSLIWTLLPNFRNKGVWIIKNPLYSYNRSRKIKTSIFVNKIVVEMMFTKLLGMKWKQKFGDSLKGLVKNYQNVMQPSTSWHESPVPSFNGETLDSNEKVYILYWSCKL